VSEAGVHLHLYATGTAAVALPEGGRVRLRIETDYPWEGEVAVRIEEAPAAPFTLALRVPNWCRDAHVELNGSDIFPAMTLRGRAEIQRAWQSGDMVRLTLPMPVDRIVSHPHVLGNRGRMALRRGPLVYCLEQADHPDADVWDIVLPEDAELTPEFVPNLLGGVTVLRGQALAQSTEEWTRRLYRPKEILREAAARPVAITAIPYYAWANRDPGPMQVWLPTLP